MSDDLGFDLPPPAVLTKTRAAAVVLGVSAVLGVAFITGYMPRRQARAALAESTKTEGAALLRLEVVAPKVAASDHAVLLPGSVQPLEETVLYPRANGFIRKWNVDIGDKVKEGQVLAEIDTPEVDQELEQARAQLAQAQASVIQSKANRDFSKTNLDRYKQLTAGGLASQQDLDQKAAQSAVDEANVTVSLAASSAQEANIRRLMQLKGFAHVLAPFDGRVTQRTVERGALVTAGNGTPLFKIAATETMRVFVQVPQDVAPGVKVDQTSQVTVREYAGRTFEGKVAHTAGALDSATRTMNTEVRVPNPKGELLAGMYAQVGLNLPTPHRVLEIPATALMNDAKGVRVAIVDAESKIHLVPVVVERDTGSAIEIASGLDPDARVVKLASAELAEGRAVEIVK